MVIKLKFNEQEKQRIIGLFLNNCTQELFHLVFQKVRYDSCPTEGDQKMFMNGFVEGVRVYNDFINDCIHNLSEKKDGVDSNDVV